MSSRNLPLQGGDFLFTLSPLVLCIGGVQVSRVILVIVVSIGFIIGCGSQPKTDGAKTENWAGKMQGLAADVKELVPYIYSRQAFHAPENAPRIKSGLRQLAKETHSITPEMGRSFFGNDPLVAYSLEGLQADLERAADAFDIGQLEYARGVAKTATNHCFRCHSVTKEASANTAPGWDLEPARLTGLAPLERVDLLVAARKYEESTRLLEGLMADKEYAQNFPFDFESALRKYLSLMIRAENDPDRPLRELDRILEIKEIPYYVAEQARAWRTSLLEWSRGKHKKAKRKPLAEARERIARAGEVQQFAKDHAGDIEYLRATALLHEHLRGTKDPKELADAYFLLGQAYEVLDELGYWNLHERYYESCITTAPKSSLARKCYGRLEASVYMGFSGSSGVHIPAAEKTRLLRLKDLTN